ncbi:uncharacterized protein LOC111250055 [Varroa destructor]|uniref:BTB domain-containing protein n=1 Tax=Varroa destructor TaxID=109461 RepID=A0A7M7K405_VARDE|nr:uncharacterized protein LOC111250055 [Varroa destructor]
MTVTGTAESTQLQPTHLHSLCKKPCQLRCKRRPCDFIIECDEGSLSAHKNVLANASGYFQGLFAGCMVEVKLSKVQLKLISLRIMTKIIDFIYKQTIDLTIDDAVDILIASQYLLIEGLMMKCSTFLKGNVNLGNAIEIYYIADHHCMSELRIAAVKILAENIVPLVSIDQFLFEVEPNLMRALLESDDLVVPHEDSVYEFFVAWLHRKPQDRKGYVDALKELIRFPFLKVTTVARLKQTFGPIKGLLELTDANNWNLEESTFRRRKYTMAHCHFLWQQHWHRNTCCNTVGFERSRLVLTCSILDQRHDTLIHGDWTSVPVLSDVEVCGHMLYSNSFGHLYHFRARTDHFLLPLKPKFTTRLPMLLGPRLYAGQDGILRLIENSGLGYLKFPNIYQFSGTTGHFEMQPASSEALVTTASSDQLIFHRYSSSLIDPITGRVMNVSYPLESKNRLCGAHWLTAIQRNDTFLFWYQSNVECSPCGLTRHKCLTSLNLSNGRWGPSIDTGKYSYSCESMLPTLVHGTVYMLNSAPNLDYGELRIDKLDEDNGLMQTVQVAMLQNAQFMGVIPVDVCTSCPMDTWLSAEIRKLPDNTPSQRALIYKLRQVAS